MGFKTGSIFDFFWQTCLNTCNHAACKIICQTCRRRLCGKKGRITWASQQKIPRGGLRHAFCQQGQQVVHFPTKNPPWGIETSNPLLHPQPLLMSFPTKNPPWGIETCFYKQDFFADLLNFPTKNPPWGIETWNSPLLGRWTYSPLPNKKSPVGD